MNSQLVSLSLRLLSREWRSGELRLLALGLLIAVASLTTVAFFSDRVRLALTQEAAQLLGADLLVVSDRPIESALQKRAQELGLRTMQVVRFPSMSRHDKLTLLTDIKAIDEHYPLKGKFTVKTQGDAKVVSGAPPRGTLWADERTLARLHVNLGERIGLGEREFTLSAILVDDPDTAIGFLNLGPRIVLHQQDLASTGLIQTGSRVSYRLGVAGAQPKVEVFRAFARSKIGPGQRVEDVREARPEIRAALERAEKFLGLAALMSAVLASVAIALAARRYLARHLDSCAVMRCLGAQASFIFGVHCLQFLLLALAASLLGCLLAYLGQLVLTYFMQPVVGVALPAPGWSPVLHGLALGVVLLAGFAIPPLVSLRKVPTLRVLRRDIGLPDGIALGAYVVGILALAALIQWQAQDFMLGTYVLLGMAAVALLALFATWLAMRALVWYGRRWRFTARFGIANLQRRPLGSLTQVVALGIGIMALLLLSLTRNDLLKSWQHSLPPDAPNRFLVNVQPDQVEAIARFMQTEKFAVPKLYPMIRGRLVTVNGREVRSKDYVEDRAKRLVDREFNLSWASELPTDNQIDSGAWFKAADSGQALLSVESGLAKTLGLRMDDMLAFEIAGERLQAKVSSLRKVEWDSFRVNFFVLAPPGLLDGYPASYISAFHLPAAHAQVMDRMVKAFPNILVIDVEVILAQVQRIMEQVVKAVEFVFAFGLLAGIMVLFSALHTTHDERLYDAAVLRTLGSTTRQLRATHAAEFIVIGTLAGALAALGATAVGYFVAERVLNVPFHFSGWVWVAGVGLGALGVLAMGLLGTYRVARTTPMEIFRLG